MKKRFWVADKVLLAVFLVCMLVSVPSCKTTDGSSHDQIVKSAIDLANEYCSRGAYGKAMEVYEKACSYAEDYRLEYNRAYVLSCLGRNREAYELCRQMYEVYPDKFIFLTASCEYLYLDQEYSLYIEPALKVLESDPYDYNTRMRLINAYQQTSMTDFACEQAKILWNQGYRNKDTSIYLYRNDPQRWDAVFRHFYPEGDPDLIKTEAVETETSQTDE